VFVIVADRCERSKNRESDYGYLYLERIHSILAHFMEINDWREIEPFLNGAH
jgi:hypothetical protein